MSSWATSWSVSSLLNPSGLWLHHTLVATPAVTPCRKVRDLYKCRIVSGHTCTSLKLPLILQGATIWMHERWPLSNSSSNKLIPEGPPTRLGYTRLSPHPRFVSSTASQHAHHRLRFVLSQKAITRQELCPLLFLVNIRSSISRCAVHQAVL